MCIRVSFCPAGVLTGEVFFILYIRKEKERGKGIMRILPSKGCRGPAKALAGTLQVVFHFSFLCSAVCVVLYW
jgi:hypothetical protein